MKFPQAGFGVGMVIGCVELTAFRFILRGKKGGETIIFSLARKIVSRRFGPLKVNRQDILRSFLPHGLLQREATTKAMLKI